jgi:hypothetical protein
VEDNDSPHIILDMRDPAGLPTSATLISLPSYGSLSALDSSFNVVDTFDSTTELPVSTTLRLLYHPDENNALTDSFTYTATNTQGLTSEPGRVEVTMFKINDDPKVEDPSAELVDANEELVVSIEVVDPDDNFVNVYVTELPASGMLYYSGDDMTKPIEAFQPSFAGRVDQYVQARKRAKEAREQEGARASERRRRASKKARERASEGGARARRRASANMRCCICPAVSLGSLLPPQPTAPHSPSR